MAVTYFMIATIMPKCALRLGARSWSDKWIRYRWNLRIRKCHAHRKAVPVGLPWIRLDTSTFDHPKILALIEAKQYKAVVVYLAAMAYSGKHGLAGYVPRSALRVIGATPNDAARLVDGGLLHVDGDGWDINGWGDYQLSGDEHEARRQRLSERGRKGAAKRWDRRKDRLDEDS